jgi:hypothetical protein
MLMLMFRLMVLGTVFLVQLVNADKIMASGFNLKSIGSIQTNSLVSHWWYTSANPRLIGEALPSVAVDVSIDGEMETIPTSSDGEWQYQPTKLTEGEHEVILKSGESIIQFKLTIGTASVDWDAVNKGPAESLPVAGSVTTTWMLLTSSLMVVVLGGKMLLHAKR